LLPTHDVMVDDLGAGELFRAATSLAKANQVTILTGFFIPLSETSGNAETDGPLGAALLGHVLSAAGISVQIITDPNCENVVRAAVEATARITTGSSSPAALKRPQFEVISSGDPDKFWSSDFGKHASHIVSIERVGRSFLADQWNRQHDGPVEQFAKLVPQDHQGRCYNMRGVDVTDRSFDLHHLFEAAPDRVTRIAIGDGGNELGMGKFGWQTIFRRLANGVDDIEDVSQEQLSVAARIPCRVSADHTIIAGVSNWGADALAAAVCLIRGDTTPLLAFAQSAHEYILNTIVNHAGAVDGVTKLAEPTVDGLPFITYIQTWNAIREIAISETH
jgi:D-glutamate cyclase